MTTGPPSNQTGESARNSIIKKDEIMSSRRMKDWYDQNVHAQTFGIGDELYVLNLRLYKGWCPKWMKWYSHVAVVQKRLNNVTSKFTVLSGKEKRLT